MDTREKAKKEIAALCAKFRARQGVYTGGACIEAQLRREVRGLRNQSPDQEGI